MQIGTVTSPSLYTPVTQQQGDTVLDLAGPPTGPAPQVFAEVKLTWNPIVQALITQFVRSDTSEPINQYPSAWVVEKYQRTLSKIDS
jgi:hypothetical protein